MCGHKKTKWDVSIVLILFSYVLCYLIYLLSGFEFLSYQCFTTVWFTYLNLAREGNIIPSLAPSALWC